MTKQTSSRPMSSPMLAAGPSPTPWSAEAARAGGEARGAQLGSVERTWPIA
jgi:hypothetical protein